MTRLSRTDLELVLGLVRDMNDSDTITGFELTLIASVRRLIPCDIITFNHVDTQIGEVEALWEPADSVDESLYEPFIAHLRDHPLIAHYASTGDDSAVKFSDFLSDEELQRLGLYNEFFRPLRITRQMALSVPAGSTSVMGVALNRSGRDFSERDREVLNMLRPFVRQALEKASQATFIKDELTNNTKGVIKIDGEGRIESANAAAELLSAQYFGRQCNPGSVLPSPVSAWLSRNSGFRFASVGPLTQTFVTRPGALTLRYWPRLLGQRFLLLEEAIHDSPAISPDFELSPREAEVLALVMRGKTNLAIGKELAISVRTVQKHLEHIFLKLDVETRTAAVARVYDAAFKGTSAGQPNSPASYPEEPF
jgi:DNA-binding CsgD family transcriptional regulator